MAFLQKNELLALVKDTQQQLLAFGGSSAECQKAGWSSHKSSSRASQARKALYRAGALVQEIFYIYREKVFDKDIESIDRDGNTITLNERAGGLVSVSHPFPATLVASRKEKNAILSCMDSSDALAYMHGTIKEALKDLYTSIHEIPLLIKTPNHHILLKTPHETKDNAKYWHEVLQITLDNGEKYIFDIAGAQFGFFDAVKPWQQFVDQHAQAIGDFHTFGVRLAFLTSKALCNGQTMKHGRRRLNAKLAARLIVDVGAWQKGNVAFTALFKLSDSILQKKERELMAILAASLEEAKKVAMEKY